MGGAAGHMAHLHEDLDLTFNELVSILNQVASADIEVTEKVDGQNLFLSARKSIDVTVDELGAIEIRTARNPTDIQKGGMTPAAYAEKWQGHPAEDAFMKGFRAIQMAIDSLPQPDVIDIFDSGKSYVNMEIMYPGNPNIIDYGASYVVLHGLKSVDGDDTSDSFLRLSQALNSAQVEVDGETWSVYGPQVITLKNIADGKAHKDAVAKIQKLAAEPGMDSTLKEYSKSRYKNLIMSEGLSEEIADHIVFKAYFEPGRDKSGKRLSVKDQRRKYADAGGLTLHQIKKLDPANDETIKRYSKAVVINKVISATLRPIEMIINEFAIEVLRGIKSFFAVDHEGAIKKMRDELEESIAYLEELAAAGDENMGQLVDRQLAKLGSIENVASSLEGIVFEYGDKVYKMTGAFAMANQIIGRARRSKPASIDESTVMTEAKIRKMVRDSIAKTYLAMLPSMK